MILYITCTERRIKHKVTENGCGNPAFYVQGDKSFNKRKIGEYDEIVGKLLFIQKCKQQ